MTAADVAADPLGQLNLILWATQPLPSAGTIRPVFREAGYRLLYIAPVLPLGPALREQLGEAGVEARQSPEPDLLLKREDAPEYLAIECKRAMFGDASSNSRQARGLLLQTGQQFRTVMNLPLESEAAAHLVYVTKHCDDPSPSVGIDEIRQRLASKGFPVAPCGVLCLDAGADGVYIRDEYQPGTVPAQLHGVVGAGIRVRECAEGESALPLMLIPWDPNVDQDSPIARVGRRAFCHRLLAELLVKVGPATVGDPVAVRYDDLLSTATFGLYLNWRVMNRNVTRGLRRFCRESIVPALDGIEGCSLQAIAGSSPGRFVTFDSAEAKDAAIESITALAHGDGPQITASGQQSLFADHE